MVSFVYNAAKVGFANGTLDWDATGFKVTLVSSYSANVDHQYTSAFSGQELSTTSFTGGFSGTMRKALGGLSVVSNTTDDQAELDGSDLTWAGISAGTACGAIILTESAAGVNSNGNALLVAFIDTGGFPVLTNGGDLTISWANSGIIKLASG